MTHVTWRPDNRKQIPAKSAHASVGHYHAQQAAPCHLATSESSQPLCFSPTWLQLPPNPSDRAAWANTGHKLGSDLPVFLLQGFWVQIS